MIRPAQMLLAAALCLTLLAFPLTALSATQLRALPQASESFDAGTIHVDRYGSGGRAIIFIPGLSCGPWSWAEQISRFSKDHTVYALTLDGFDGRAYVPQSDLIASFENDFWSLLRTHNIDKPIVIGHSLGGTLAIALAETHPERLAGVIALDGLPVFPAVATSTPAQRAAYAKSVQTQIEAESHQQLLRYDVGFMKQIGTIRPALVEPAAALEAKSDPKAVAAWAAADFSDDLRSALPHANVRMLELMPYAAPSQYTEEQTLGFYRMLLAGAPQATVKPIPGARHFAMLDQPAEVDDAITRFLQAEAH